MIKLYFSKAIGDKDQEINTFETKEELLSFVKVLKTRGYYRVSVDGKLKDCAGRMLGSFKQLIEKLIK